MEFHYVVAYDSETKKWSVEDETKYLDGNIWNDEDAEWFWADENNSPVEFEIDEKCRIMLSTLASIWPEVDHGN